MSQPVNMGVSNVQDVVASNVLPASFAGDAVLFGVNLACMTAFTCLGVMVVGWLTLSLYAHRKFDHWLDPVTIYRGSWLCAGIALTLRCGGQAAVLWAWDPAATKTAATVLTVQRYLDPIALTFAGGWLSLLALTYPAMVLQLRKRPYPIPILLEIPRLKMPIVVVLMSIVAAGLVTWLRAQAGI